ncbi:MAG: penicillin-binding protein [Desulfuromonadales bacterium]|jgi:cell division protein FtsI (penicillin-binding protein 3)
MAGEKWVGIRIRLIGCCFLAVFALIVARAFQLQVLASDDWRKRAERQHQKIIPLTPQRGTIYDRNQEALALSLEVDSIYADPSKISDPAHAARALSAALSLPYQSVQAKLASEKSFQWLKRQVTQRESQAVSELDIEGVNFIKEHRRYYPNSEIGAQVIGFTGLDPAGLEGVELAYDAEILGRGGYLVTERDALGRGLGAGAPVIEGGQGSSLYLTLDKNLQYLAEKELAAGVRQVQARAGTVVMLDPQTGQVLAMASQPDFNPNAFNQFRPEQWRNRTICDTFEPGSTFKPFLVAAALNEKLLAPQQRIFTENGKYVVGGRTIHDGRAYGNLSVTEILKYSSNIGMAKIAKMLERERAYRYLTAFGFGAPTGIGLPGEVGGVLRKPADWFEVDLAAVSFGQSVSVTALQLTSAMAAIANGGYLMQPYVVERVVDSFGQEIDYRRPKVVRQVISEEVSRQLRQMLSEITEEGGTGMRASVPGYRVAGKTGTAQKVDLVTGGYSADKRVASFIGMAPVEAPRLIILVVIDEPEGQVYGSLVAAPVFAKIAAQALRYLQVPPTEPITETARVQAPAAPVAAELAGAQALAGRMENGQLRMPDFAGLSYRQVLRVMEKTGINVKLNGSGRVLEQHPLPGQPVRYGTEVWVRFATPS